MLFTLSCEGGREEINIYDHLRAILEYYNNEFDEIEITDIEYIIEMVNPNDSIFESVRNITIKYQEEMEEKTKREYPDYVSNDDLLFRNQEYYGIEMYIEFIIAVKFKPISRNMNRIFLQQKMIGRNGNGILLLNKYYYKYYSDYEKQEIIIGIQKEDKFFLCRKIIDGSFSKLIYDDENIDNIFLEI